MPTEIRSLSVFLLSAGLFVMGPGLHGQTTVERAVKPQPVQQSSMIFGFHADQALQKRPLSLVHSDDSGVLAQRPGDQQGKIRSRRGVPLVALVGPGSGAEVVVEKDQAPPLFIEPPSSADRLQWMAKQTPYVLVVSVEAAITSLTPDRDWVETTVLMRVEEVLKHADVPVERGQTITFVQDGGNITLGQTVVRARVSWADNFEQGARYLVFADGPVDGSTDWRVIPKGSYKIGFDSSLESLATDPRARTEEAGTNLASALNRIRSVVKGAR